MGIVVIFYTVVDSIISPVETSIAFSFLGIILVLGGVLIIKHKDFFK
jgi:hypothetical protein